MITTNKNMNPKIMNLGINFFPIQKYPLIPFFSFAQ